MNTLTDTNAQEYARSISAGLEEMIDRPEWRSLEDLRDDFGTALSVGAWLEDALDIEYRVDSSKRYRSAKILIAFGGPNAWIDTEKSTVNVYWGAGATAYTVPEEFCTELDDYLTEIWQA